MKNRIALLLALVLLCVFPGCASPAPTAEKPCVLVGGTLYYMGGERAADALPEGYVSAGKLEGVRDFPRVEMTGLVPDGSEVYVSEEKPEAVYVRMDGLYACFTAERLQYTWLMAEGARYLREDDYRKAYPDAPVNSFDGGLPSGAEYRGNLRSFVPDALPSKDFETNFKPFVGYAVYVLPDEPEAVFLRQEPGASGAIRFLRDPEETAAPAEK